VVHSTGLRAEIDWAGNIVPLSNSAYPETSNIDVFRWVYKVVTDGEGRGGGISALGGTMRIISFIADGAGINKILRHVSAGAYELSPSHAPRGFVP
jgi:hypothetical protein